MPCRCHSADRTVSWGELYERARCVAGGLRAAGVGAQDRVAFLDKNGIEHFEVALWRRPR